ncbi:hypothetical protein ACP4OV_010216 [Aristida adscensionis]
MSQDDTTLPQDVQRNQDHTTCPGVGALTSAASEMLRADGFDFGIKNNNIGLKQASSTLDDACKNSTRVEQDDTTTAKNDASWKSMSTKSSLGADHVHDVFVPMAGNNRASRSGKGKAIKDAEAIHTLHVQTERQRRQKFKNMLSNLHALVPNLSNKADKATIVGETVSYIRVLEGTIQHLEKLKLERMRAQQLAVSSSVPPHATRQAALADKVQGWNAQQAPPAAATAMAQGSNMQQAAATATASTAGSSAAAAAAVAACPALQTWSAPSVTVSVSGGDAFISVCTPRQQGMVTKVLLVLEKHSVDVLVVTISSDANRSMFSIQARIKEDCPQLPQDVTAEERYKLVVSEVLQLLGD